MMNFRGKELLLGLMEINTLENIKMGSNTDKELILLERENGKEINILEDIKMVNGKGKELILGLIV